MCGRHHVRHPYRMHGTYGEHPRVFPFFLVMIFLWVIFESGTAWSVVGMALMMLPMVAVIALIVLGALYFLKNGDFTPMTEKRKNGGTNYDYFEPESTDDSNIIRTTDGKRYIRTETGEYKQIAE